MASEIQLALCTCPDESTADRLAETLVERKLAACVNMIPTVRSVYRWQGKVQRDGETLLLIKFAGHRAGQLKEAILEQHPYDTPEIVVVDISDGSADYLNWVLASCKDSA